MLAAAEGKGARRRCDGVDVQRIADSGLSYEDGDIWVFGKPTCDDVACCTAADNDEVEL